jgi:hypothetical protein
MLLRELWPRFGEHELANASGAWYIFGNLKELLQRKG